MDNQKVLSALVASVASIGDIFSDSSETCFAVRAATNLKVLADRLTTSTGVGVLNGGVFNGFERRPATVLVDGTVSLHSEEQELNAASDWVFESSCGVKFNLCTYHQEDGAASFIISDIHAFYAFILKV